jgi:predicted alpha/beta hydrolase
MAGVVDGLKTADGPGRLFHVGQRVGGQTVGLLPNGNRIDAVVTLSFLAGDWRLQGGLQEAAVFVHRHFTLLLRPHLFGYTPWGGFGWAEEIPGLPCNGAAGAGIRAACRAMPPCR